MEPRQSTQWKHIQYKFSILSIFTVFVIIMIKEQIILNKLSVFSNPPLSVRIKPPPLRLHRGSAHPRHGKYLRRPRLRRFLCETPRTRSQATSALESFCWIFFTLESLTKLTNLPGNRVTLSSSWERFVEQSSNWIKVSWKFGVFPRRVKFGMTFFKRFFKDWIGEMILLSCTWRRAHRSPNLARVNFGGCFCVQIPRLGICWKAETIERNIMSQRRRSDFRVKQMKGVSMDWIYQIHTVDGRNTCASWYSKYM